MHEKREEELHIVQGRFPEDKALHQEISGGLPWSCKKLGLSVSGRRNAFGAFQGRRQCEWQSGTTPSFAVGFGSNTHTLPNWRLPPVPEVHDTTICRSRTCAMKCASSRDSKVISKLAQRTQRQCTGYYCGYTFKPPPVGQTTVRLAAESLNYLEPKLQDKTAGQRWRRITHRVLVDQQHRCNASYRT